MLVQAENSKRGNRFRSGLSTAALDRLSQQLAQKGLALLTQSFYYTKEKDTGNKFLRSTLIFSIFNKCQTDIYSFIKVGQAGDHDLIVHSKCQLNFFSIHYQLYSQKYFSLLMYQLRNCQQQVIIRNIIEFSCNCYTFVQSIVISNKCFVFRFLIYFMAFYIQSIYMCISALFQNVQRYALFLKH